MKLIYAEKYDVAIKIAAALDKITLPGGTVVTFKNLPRYKAEAEKLAKKNGYLDIFWNGEPWRVTFGYGHIYGLKDVFEYNKAYKSWSARPECFIPERYELRPNTSKTVQFQKTLERTQKTVGELFRKAEFIINATDDDREGELIFAYVYEATKCKAPFSRVHLSSQTQSGFITAFSNLLPSCATKNRELAGRARSIYDWLIGTNLSTRVTLKMNDRSVWSIGRVQTWVLKMLYDLEKRIREFKPEPFWNVNAVFTTASDEQYDATYKESKMRDKVKAESVYKACLGHPGTVTAIDSKTIVKEIPLLYSQTALQIDANKLFGYSTKMTLDIAQKLYEGGYTTYPRTKSQRLNDDMEPTVIEILKSLSSVPAYGKYINGRPLKPAKKFFDSSKVSSHFAIIPTGTIPENLSKEQQNIYDLICYSLIRTIYPDAKLSKTIVETTVNGYPFQTTGTAVLDLGWMAVAYKSKETLLPALHKGEHVDGKYTLKEGKTSPPARYDDASLVAMMKSAGKTLEDDELRKVLADPDVEGIGTDATRAEIIETLIKRGYAERRGKAFYITDKGTWLIEHLPPLDMLSAAFTARMEQNLSLIEKGKLDYANFIREIEEQAKNWCHMIETAGNIAAAKKTPSQSTATYGAPPLDFGTKKANSGSRKTQQVSKEPAKTTNTSPRRPQKIPGMKCPLCGMEIAANERMWGCTGCQFKVSRSILSHSLSDQEFADIINRGRTATIRDFVSKKTGKKFSAYLYLEPDTGNVQFKFD